MTLHNIALHFPIDRATGVVVKFWSDIGPFELQPDTELETRYERHRFHANKRQ